MTSSLSQPHSDKRICWHTPQLWQHTNRLQSTQQQTFQHGSTQQQTFQHGSRPAADYSRSSTFNEDRAPAIAEACFASMASFVIFTCLLLTIAEAYAFSISIRRALGNSHVRWPNDQQAESYRAWSSLDTWTSGTALDVPTPKLPDLIFTFSLSASPW